MSKLKDSFFNIENISIDGKLKVSAYVARVLKAESRQ